MSTNKLIYKTSKTVGNKHIIVKIRLDDECKNGHQDFAITGDIYEAGKPLNDRYHIAGGCMHEEIVKAWPEFAPFVKLHLSDLNGCPMSAIANGYYHLKNGFNNVSVKSDQFKKEFCEYYRVTGGQFEKLKTAINQTHYAILLMDLNVPEQWKKEANAAIKQLEKLTGDTFLRDSKRTQWDAPTKKER